jgi:hypothetical protein
MIGLGERTRGELFCLWRRVLPYPDVLLPMEKTSMKFLSLFPSNTTVLHDVISSAYAFVGEG